MIAIASDSVILSHGDAKAEVRLFGATVTKFSTAEREHLFLSSLATLDGPKATRGGIPIVFPQFGPGLLPQHGFARVSLWTFGGVIRDCVSDVCCLFTLEPNQIPHEQHTLFPFGKLTDVGDNYIRLGSFFYLVLELEFTTNMIFTKEHYNLRMETRIRCHIIFQHT